MSSSGEADLCYEMPQATDNLCRMSGFANSPISFEMMADPVVASDGQTYERADIERWFRAPQLPHRFPPSALGFAQAEGLPVWNLRRQHASGGGGPDSALHLAADGGAD